MVIDSRKVRCIYAYSLLKVGMCVLDKSFQFPISKDTISDSYDDDKIFMKFVS